MGIKWRADLRVEFEMKDDQPDNLGETVFKLELGRLRTNIERGDMFGRTGVKPGSARVEYLKKPQRA